jgi:F-type H+-transporting ATPase subunit epsilon
MADFKLQVVTPERIVLDETVSSIIVPGTLGYLGVLAHHAPLLTTLSSGRLTVRRADESREYRMAGGFLEVSNNVATVLCDSFESLHVS